MVDEGHPRHAIIALWMIHRHKTFIAPEKMELWPIGANPQIPGPEQLIDTLRGRAAGKAEAKTLRRIGNSGRDKARDKLCQGLRIRRSFDDRRGRHERPPGPAGAATFQST